LLLQVQPVIVLNMTRNNGMIKCFVGEKFPELMPDVYPIENGRESAMKQEH
jgi:hypothetical protein